MVTASKPRENEQDACLQGDKSSETGKNFLWIDQPLRGKRTLRAGPATLGLMLEKAAKHLQGLRRALRQTRQLERSSVGVFCGRATVETSNRVIATALG